MHAELAYIFRHALVREAAYALQLPSERSELHMLAIECVDVASAGDEPDAIAAELARHAMQAQAGTQATRTEQLAHLELDYRRRAADYAMKRDAAAEVVEHMLRMAELPQPNVKARMDCLARAGSLCMGLGMLARSEAVAWRMNALALAAGDAVQEARSLRALMAVEATVGKHELADQHLRRSLAILEQHGDRRELSSTLRAFALHMLSRGRYQESQQWIDRALPFAQDSDWERALLHDTQGELHNQQGRFDEALESYRNCIQLSLAAGNPGKARETRAGYARALLELGRVEEAETEARLLLEEYRKAGRMGDVSSVQGILAAAAASRGRYDEAIEMYRGVLAVQHEQGRAWYQIEISGSLAQTLCQARRYDEALAYAGESLRLSLEQDSRSGIAKAHWIRGWVFHEQGRLTEAEQELALAAGLQEKLQEKNRLGLVQARLLEVRRALG